MLDDNDDAIRESIRRQADDDVAAFIAQLDSDVGTGVPPPPTIEVTEVSSQPVELEFVPFGRQGSETTPAPGGGTDPAPATCPETCPGVTFSGIEFCCFSLPGFETRSIRFDDSLDPINGTLFSPISTPGDLPCCLCGESQYNPIATVHFYSWPTPDCSDDFDNDSSIQVLLATARIAGVWHVLLYSEAFGDPIIFFYGTTTSLAVPATNEITCGSSQTYDNPLIQCIHGSSWDMTPAGFNGTATLS